MVSQRPSRPSNIRRRTRRHRQNARSSAPALNPTADFQLANEVKLNVSRLWMRPSATCHDVPPGPARPGPLASIPISKMQSGNSGAIFRAHNPLFARVFASNQNRRNAADCARLRSMSTLIPCALYLRVSTSDQNTDNQLPALQTMALARGCVIVDVIREQLSGAKRQRPGLAQVLAGAHEGRYRFVFVWALDRLGRSMAGVLETVQELDRCGCRVVSHQESWLSLDGPVRPLLIAVFAWVAEQERQRMIERTRAGLATARAKGIQLGRRRVHVDLDAAMRLRKSGLSIAATARRLGIGAATLCRALRAEADSRHPAAPSRLAAN